MEKQLVKIENGVHFDVSIEDYHAENEHLSASSIKEASKSMKHFLHYREKKHERKSHFDFGNAFELAFLDWKNKTMFFDDYVIVLDEDERPDKTKTIASALNQEWKKGILNSGKLVISKTGTESLETIIEMLQSCAADATLTEMMKNTEDQTSCFWDDSVTGLKLKCRPDFTKQKKGVVLDLKTTRDASPKGFAKDVANYEYPIQALMQMRGLIESGYMESINKYYWISVEKVSPYNVVIYEFDMEDWQYVGDKLDYILSTIKKAQDDGVYLGYSQQADNKFGILRLELPLYYRY